MNPKEFYSKTCGAQKIIVVDLGFLGDTVHLIPALWEIKQNYPAATLHVLTSPVGCEVLKLAPCVDKAWAFPLGPPSPSWWEHWDVIKALRRERFDMAVNFSGADRSVFITALIRAKESMVYQGARNHFWQPWIIKNWIARRKLPTPVYEARRHILELGGLTLHRARFEAVVPETERNWAEINIPAGAVHLSLSASFALKEWPLANNVKFVKSLLARDFDRTLLITASANAREQARLAEFQSEVNDPRVQVINERLSVVKLAAMLQRCALHVGPDSGMIHLAWIVNTPTISLFRQYQDAADFLPVGAPHACFSVPCVCVNSKEQPCKIKNQAECLASILPEKVVAEVLSRLENLQARGI